MIPVLFLRHFFKFSPLDLLQGVLYNREKPIRATSAPSARTASERVKISTISLPSPAAPPLVHVPSAEQQLFPLTGMALHSSAALQINCV